MFCERDGEGEEMGAGGVPGEVGDVVKVLVTGGGVVGSEIDFPNLSGESSDVEGVAGWGGVRVAGYEGAGVAPSAEAEMAAVCAGKVLEGDSTSVVASSVSSLSVFLWYCAVFVVAFNIIEPPVTDDCESVGL